MVGKRFTEKRQKQVLVSRHNNESTIWFERIWQDPIVLARDSESAISNVDFILDFLDVFVGSRILDVACGTGLEAVELASRGYVVTGLDLSKSMLQYAKEHATKRRQEVRWLNMDMRCLDSDEDFELIMVRDVIIGLFSHSENNKVLKAFHRALAPEGKLLLEVYNKNYALQNGIENTLEYNSANNYFEGMVTISGNEDERVFVQMALQTPQEWRRTLLSLGFTNFQCVSEKGEADCETSRIIFVSAQKQQKCEGRKRN